MIKVYVDLSTTSGPVSLNILSMGNRNRAFDIRVTYIHCASTYRGLRNKTYKKLGFLQKKNNKFQFIQL